MTNLTVTTEGELAAFLAFWLSRFVLPYGKEVIWPETFFLSYMYHQLGEAASHPDHPGKANAIFPSHYVIGWLAELFPYLYRRRPDNNRPSDFPPLFVMLDCLVANFPYLEPYTFSGLGDIFISVVALIMRTLVMAKMRLIWASRVRVSQSLSALHSIIDIYKLSTIEICWLSSKIEEIFSVVETVAKIEELVDVDRVNALFDQVLTCSFEIAHIEGQLNNLPSKASKLKVKEQVILREEERIRKMQEN
ncbi:hypothetical protein Cgig2_029753 [Carnegiea gigantea]|uniref:Aminotransferase-like plant mobile domain-containing protein n=1 Tax=Carnegiea gigantea TaxID=171969 RepID=A0A9Q1K2C9_9CARY|nr:hypothetical protein Cgig2_029753 [Carnegiea gigantea]